MKAIDARGTSYAAHSCGAAVLRKEGPQYLRMTARATRDLALTSHPEVRHSSDTALGAASAGEARFQTVVLKILCACGVQNLGQKILVAYATR